MTNLQTPEYWLIFSIIGILTLARTIDFDKKLFKGFNAFCLFWLFSFIVIFIDNLMQYFEIKNYFSDFITLVYCFLLIIIIIFLLFDKTEKPTFQEKIGKLLMAASVIGIILIYFWEWIFNI